MKLLAPAIFLFASSLILTTGMAVAQNNTSTVEMKPSALKRIKENTKINYFGEFAGSNLKKWDDNQYDYEGKKTGTPSNLYNQFNIQYKFLPTTSFLLSPRFYAQVGDRNDLKKTEDPHTVVIDDWQIGIVQQFFRSKEVNYTGQLTHRHPLSTASKNSQIDSQVEYQNSVFWLASPAVSMLFWNTYRYYVYEASKNEDRYRINFTTLLNYSLNDKWRLQLMHDWDMQHRAPKYGSKDVNKQDWNYFERYKNSVAFGIGYSPVPAFTVIPFVKALNDKDWSQETTQVGVWFLGKVL